MIFTERRRSPRFPLRADVEIEWGSETLRVRTSDISIGGMLLETHDPLWVGASFSARVSLSEPLRVDCVVRRVLPGLGMGVEFDRLTEEERLNLEKLVGQLGG